MELKIDSEFKSLIPPLTEEEYNQLEQNIIQEGIRDKIIVWHGTIIDGHNRYEIAKKHGLNFEIEEKNFNNKEQAKEWIILNQLGRRNLTPYDRSRLALKLKPLIEKKAKEKQKEHGGTAPGKSLSQKSDEVNTKKELAKIAGVSHDTIHKVEVIDTKGSDKIKQQVKSGELSINQAYILTKSEEEAKRKNEEYQKQYEEQLQKERQAQEKKQRQREYEVSLPENTVVLDKFRKPEETHIFGIKDFNNLTEEQLDKCIKHAKKYQDAIYRVNQLSTDMDSLKAWNCISDSKEMIEIELDDINSAIQKLITIQNYFKEVKK